MAAQNGRVGVRRIVSVLAALATLLTLAAAAAGHIGGPIAF